MVQRTSVRGINRYGRASQGVRVMNLREDDQVSAVALVVESEAQTAAQVIENGAPAEDGAAAGNGAVSERDAAADDPAATEGDAPDGAGSDETA
jgi:DNA gyrase subunit A